MSSPVPAGVEVVPGDVLDAARCPRPCRASKPHTRLNDAMELLRNALDSKESVRRKAFLDTFLQLIPGYAPASDGLGRYASDRKIA